MTIWTKSFRLSKRKLLIESYFTQTLSIKLPYSRVDQLDIFVGWGIKANTNKIKQQAEQLDVCYLHLEDGFIGYIGHPSKKGIAVSLISDQQGIYYDARQPCDLEKLIKQPLTTQQLARVKNLRKSIIEKGVTKYNIYDSINLPRELCLKLNKVKQEKILIVDQVAGDLSITGSLADENSFLYMVKQARTNHPNASLLLRTYPDTRLGKKKGVLAKLWAQGKLADIALDIEIIDEHCHPHALINAVDIVYTVSSQMGFEALLLNKPVYCFGMPFYAGWGLTTDVLSCERREKVSLAQLVYAALVEYCHYYNPILNEKCQPEDIINIISLQQKVIPPRSRLYLIGFSFWKRSFLKRFCQHLAEELVFVKQPPVDVSENEAILVWGAKFPELTHCLRVEDGFIRSSGLGANLCRPSSLSIDQTGIYFDNRTPNDLENSLNYDVLTTNEQERGHALINKINVTGVSKYNVGERKVIVINNNHKRILLVVGQVDGDASIITGSLHIKSNEALLYAVKNANPDAYIIYKPHPDVVSGNRKGNVSLQCTEKCIDETITHLSLTSLYSHINELHTMTSLSGFEALLNDVDVHVWGQPFYAGWGLTTDYYPPSRRLRTRTLTELVFITLVKYPLYIDWDTGLWITPELLITKVVQVQNQDINKQSFLNRKLVKLKYFLDAFS